MCDAVRLVCVMFVRWVKVMLYDCHGWCLYDWYGNVVRLVRVMLYDWYGDVVQLAWVVFVRLVW